MDYVKLPDMTEIKLGNEEVYCVFKTNGRYIFIKKTPKSLEIANIKKKYFNFPSEELIRNEDQCESAIRAAKKLGFEVIPKRHFYTKKAGDRIKHYVLCELLELDLNTIKELERNEDILLISANEARVCPYISRLNKSVIEHLEL